MFSCPCVAKVAFVVALGTQRIGGRIPGHVQKEANSLVRRA